MPKNIDHIDFWKNWIHQTPDIIFMKDLNGVYTCVSLSAAKLAGFSCEDEMIGKTDFEIYPEESAKTFTQQDKYVITKGEDSLVKDWVEHPKKGLVLLETIKSPLYDENNNLIGIQGISRDATEKCKYERIINDQQAQIIAIIDNIPFPIWMKDTDGRYLIVNKAFEQFFNLKRDDVIGINPLEYVQKSSKFSDKLEKAKSIVFEDAKIIKGKIIVNESEHVDLFGDEFFLEITKCPIVNESGEVIGVAGISVDVTSHKLYEKGLLKARKAAEQANKMKSEFLANMSHEIRTPMNGIMGFMQLLKDTTLDDEQLDFVDEAMKSSENLLKILNDVLDLSKIEAGKMSMEKIGFNIRYVVEDVATLASSNAAAKNVEISALCHSSVPEKVIGDPGRLKQVLNNFVNNSIKFTENGEVIISVNLVEKTDKKVKLEFSIKDTGIGISEENKEKIFEAFTQADSSTTRKYGGTGLGLTISKNIIKMMKGEVDVKGEIGVGSEFIFTAEFSIAKNVDDEPIQRKDLSGLNVLAVDDNKTNLHVISHYLSEYGVNCMCAISAQEALKYVVSDDKTIDIILTDCCMPEVSGIELTQIVHKMEKYKNVPVVLLTSRAQRGDYRLMQENMIRGYLPKPIRKNDLLDCISMLLSETSNASPSKKTLSRSEIITRHTIQEKHKSENLKILVVEDNPLNQKLAVKMLNKGGYACDIAQNGKEAVEACFNKKYDMIFMDCQMPVLSGYEATKEIRDKEEALGKAHIPIIAMTANAMTSDVKDCKDAGMDDYMAKPINFSILMEKVKKYTPESKTIIIKASNVKSKILSLSKEEIVEAINKDLGLEKDESLELLNEFLSHATTQVQDLQEAFKNGDFEKISQIAHSIKGASGSLRINQIFELSSQIDDLARKNLAEKIPELINSTIEELNILTKN